MSSSISNSSPPPTGLGVRADVVTGAPETTLAAPMPVTDTDTVVDTVVGTVEDTVVGTVEDTVVGTGAVVGTGVVVDAGTDWGAERGTEAALVTGTVLDTTAVGDVDSAVEGGAGTEEERAAAVAGTAAGWMDVGTVEVASRPLAAETSWPPC